MTDLGKWRKTTEMSRKYYEVPVKGTGASAGTIVDPRKPNVGSYEALSVLRDDGLTMVVIVSTFGDHNEPLLSTKTYESTDMDSLGITKHGNVLVKSDGTDMFGNSK